MNCKKSIGFQCLFSFCALSLFFISLSYAKEAVVQENISFKGGEMTPELASEPILSKEQLTLCHEKTVLVNQTAKKLNKQLNTLESHKLNIDGLRQKLEIKKASLDLHNQEFVNEYNLANKKLNVLTQNHSIEAENYNKRVKQYRSDIEVLKNECADKRYVKNIASPIIFQ